MKATFLSILLTLLISTPVMAEKPSWASKGKPTAEQKEAHQSVKNKKEIMEAEHEDAEDKVKEAKKEKDHSDGIEDQGKDKTKGLEKHKGKKSEQERKELDKGSDKGKEARETHSKKWWKFW